MTANAAICVSRVDQIGLANVQVAEKPTATATSPQRVFEVVFHSIILCIKRLAGVPARSAFARTRGKRISIPGRITPVPEPTVAHAGKRSPASANRDRCCD